MTPANDSDWSGLDDDALLQLLWTEGDRLPRAAIDEVARRGERLIPRLGELISDEDAWEDLERPGCWAVVHATLALSATGRPEAAPHLIGAIRRAEEQALDWIIDVGCALFNRIGPVCFPQLREAWNDPDILMLFVRPHMLEAMAALSLEQPDLQRLVIEEAARATREGDADTQVAAEEVLADFAALGKRDEVLAALAAKLPPAWLDRSSDEAPFALARRDPLAFYDPEALARRHELREDDDREPVDIDVEDGWPSDEDDLDIDDDDDEGPDELPSPEAPIVRTEPKVGRNDPCPCGSGRKHKKCCLV